MAGQSRAARRREKKRKQQANDTTTISSTSTTSTVRSTPSNTNKRPQNLATTYNSDSDSDASSSSAADGAGNAVIPLKSLETANVRDFIAELEQSATQKQQKNSKRVRAEWAQHEIDTKKKRYREDKAQKIVWRKFDRENRAFEDYYQRFLQLSATEWERFLASLKEPLPIHVRINGNYKSLSEIVTGTLETDFDLSNMVVKLPSGDEKQVRFAPVEWIPGQKTLWKLTIDSKSFRKCEPLKDLSNYFQAQGYLGTLLRQEPSTTILPAFLDVRPGHKVLDLCGGGEHRAPMIVESLTHDAEDDEENALLKQHTGVLVVNEQDASAAANAVRSLSRTLALSREAVVTAHKPVEYPLPYDYNGDDDGALFDRVICSVPCSGDGLVRKIPEKWRVWNPANAFKFHSSQLALASKAISLINVGGSVLYSTRSLNPIENEAVVAEILRIGNGAIELVDVFSVYPEMQRLNGATTWDVLDEEMNNVDSWKKASEEQMKTLRSTMWPPSTEEAKTMHLERCVRILPHQNDTHGLFLAVLKKTRKGAMAIAGPAANNASSNAVEKKKHKTAKKILGSFSVIEEKNYKAIRSFYGLHGGVTRAHVMERSGFAKDKSVHLVTTAVSTLLVTTYKGRLGVYKAGVEALRRSAHGYDLTDEGARILLPQRRMIQLQMDEFSTLLNSKEMWLKNTSESVGAVLSEMKEGSLVVVLDDMEPAQTGDRDIVLVATRRHNSYSITSTSAAIRRVRSLISELNAEEDEDDGYDSFEFEE